MSAKHLCDERATPEDLHAAPTRVRVLISGEETDGRFSLVEVHERPGAEPPLHTHTREDELIVVLQGCLTVHQDGDRRDCPTGTAVLLPRGREHTYRVASGDARLLVMLLPAGLEGFYRELGDVIDGLETTPDAEWLVTALARYGVEITGPGPDVTGSALSPQDCPEL